MKILLAVDGSKAAHDAVDCVLSHAEWFREPPQLELVTVHLPLPRMRLSVGKARIARYYQDEGEANLAAAKKRLDTAGVPYTARVLVGPIAETIVKHAREKSCDLICLGSRGAGGLGKMLLGSTVTRVLQLSGVPVLVAK
jgi:nucleotide-binding universal stress UspA family protein